MNTVPTNQQVTDPVVAASVVLINGGIYRFETADTVTQQVLGLGESAAGVVVYGTSKLFKAVQHVAAIAADAAVDKVKASGEVTAPESQALKVVGTMFLGMLGIHSLL